jgi:hypothetical protein
LMIPKNSSKTQPGVLPFPSTTTSSATWPRYLFFHRFRSLLSTLSIPCFVVVLRALHALSCFDYLLSDRIDFCRLEYLHYWDVILT